MSIKYKVTSIKMSSSEISCPSCKVNKLKLYQINLEEAVYLCINKNCTYPKGHDFIVVKRSADNIATNVEVFNEAEIIDLDLFVNDTLQNMLN